MGPRYNLLSPRASEGALLSVPWAEGFHFPEMGAFTPHCLVSHREERMSLPGTSGLFFGHLTSELGAEPPHNTGVFHWLRGPPSSSHPQPPHISL